MITGLIQKTMLAVAQMSYETWVSILLAALAVLLAVVTLIVAIAGIAIAIVGIWGLKAMRKAAEQDAHKAVKQTIAKYPDATRFIEVHKAMQELYRQMQQQMAVVKQEYEVFHQRTEDASSILERLSSKRGSAASNSSEVVDEMADKKSEPIVAIYPGEEVDSDDSNVGKSIKDEGSASTDSR
jgi:uncharacterized protein YdiU (UPF0061 family)